MLEFNKGNVLPFCGQYIASAINSLRSVKYDQNLSALKVLKHVAPVLSENEINVNTCPGNKPSLVQLPESKGSNFPWRTTR